MTNNSTTENTATTETLLLKGWHCYNGIDCHQDFAAAANHWRQAAEEAQDAMAMYNLACLYMRGEGVTTDHAQGLEWLRKAAALDNNRAREALRDVEKVGQSHFNVASQDIDFAKRRRYIIIGLIILLLLVAVTIISIPNKFGMG